MADVLVRDGPEDEWRPVAPPWTDIHSEKAEKIVEQYNNKEIYDKEYKVGYEEWEE